MRGLDPVFDAYLEATARAARSLPERSDVLELSPLPPSDALPRAYRLAFAGCEHVVRTEHGRLAFSEERIDAALRFPMTYCRTSAFGFVSAAELFSIRSPLAHPNVSGGHVCLEHAILPATPLDPLLTMLYAILSSRVYNLDSALDGEAADFYRRHEDRISRLRTPPLWRAGT